MIPKHKIDDIWRSGYCRETVEHAKTTTPDAAGARERTAYLSQHIGMRYNADTDAVELSDGGCFECLCANVLKNIEGEVAAAMGPGFFTLFAKGGDVSTFSEFRPVFERIMGAHFTEGKLLTIEGFMNWLTRAAGRGPYDAK